ncbi:hypothetical protein E4U45_002928 [Claviceps purpurea]|nr:hypothetical protein E4U45_002928 [Claviceps purpurea]
MFAIKLFFFAALAVLASVTLAEVTGKFNVASYYTQPQTDQHGHTKTVRTHQSWQFQTKVKSQKTLDKLVHEFGAWSGHEFTCKKGRHGPSYNIVATRDYPNKNDALASNQRARSVVNNHKNEE